jgi:hypothetical protein
MPTNKKKRKLTLKEAVAIFNALDDGDISECSDLSDSDDIESAFMTRSKDPKPSCKGLESVPSSQVPKAGSSRKASKPGPSSQVPKAGSSHKTSKPGPSSQVPKAGSSCKASKHRPCRQNHSVTEQVVSKHPVNYVDVEPDSDDNATDEYNFDEETDQNMNVKKTSCQKKKVTNRDSQQWHHKQFIKNMADTQWKGNVASTAQEEMPSPLQYFE